MYMKRSTVPKSWPIARKGTKYVIRASHNRKNGIPLLIILREILKAGKNRKEVKKILNLEKVTVNGKIAKKEALSVLPFSIIKIGEKNYELIFSDKRKFALRETTRKNKILKVVGKKLLKNKKIQLNLMFGENINVDAKEKAKIGDSVIVEGKKILSVIPIEKNKEAVILSGKHQGREGKIEKIEDKTVTLNSKEEKINIGSENILVIK